MSDNVMGALRDGKAVATDALSDAEVVKGHPQAWGGEGNLYSIRPYTLSGSALEAFTVRERIHIAVDGLGEDLVDLHGVGVYRRHQPRVDDETAKRGDSELSWRTATIGAQFLSLQVIGYSKVFGQIRVTNTPMKREGAIVSPNMVPRVGQDPAITPMKNCVTQLSPRFEIEKLGTIVDTGKESVLVESRVNMVPPIGDVSRTEKTYTLFDGEREVGKLLAADLEIGALLYHQDIEMAAQPVEAQTVVEAAQA